MPDDDEPDHRQSAAPAPAYAAPDSDLDSDLDSIPPQPRSPSHPTLPRLMTITTGSPVRSIMQTSSPKGLRSPIGFGSPPQDSPSRNPERQLISHPQTPPNNRNRYGLHHQHGSRSPSPSPHHLPPPPPAASTTLYHLVGGLGLGPSSPLSPFRRQFSAPLQAVRSSSRAPSFASIVGSRPSTGYGTGTGSGTFFTHVNDSHGTVHHLAIKDDDDHTSHSLHADDELSDDEQSQHPRERVSTAPTVSKAQDNYDDLTQDSKDVLVERLTDLIHHLQGAKGQTTGANRSVLSDVSISELHAKVDEMEAVLTGKGTGVTGGSRMVKRPVGPSAKASRCGIRHNESGDESESDGEKDEKEDEKHPHSPLNDMLAFASSAAAAAAPGWLVKSFSGSEPSPPESRAQSPSPASKKAHLKLAEATEIKPSAVGGADMAAAVSIAEVEVQPQKPREVETERIAAEAEKLAAQLEAVLKSLETRREESNHVHALLVERAEAAAFRIVELEKEVLDLEEEISCQESELKHLRLELRAIETLVNEFLPPVEAADPELVRSIENWKADWKRLREQMLSKSRRKERGQQQEKPDAHGGHEGHEKHEEGLRNGKERKHKHDHEHHEKDTHHETHETRDLSVVVEVTEESLRSGQQRQQQHRNGNGDGVGFGGDGQEDDAMAGTAAAPVHAVRVSRTGA